MSAHFRANLFPAVRRLLLLLSVAGGGLFAQPTAPAAKPSETAEQEADEIVGAPDQSKPDPAAEKFWAAVKLLQSKKPTDIAAGRAALQAVSDQEYTHAQALLGNCHLSGSYGFAKDTRKAANLFRLAAERGNAFAKVTLGSQYATGTGVRKDEAKAAEWLTAALAPDADFSQPARPPPDPSATEENDGGVAGELANDPVSESQATAHFLLAQILAGQKKASEAQTHYVAAASAGIGGRSGSYPAAVQAALNYAFGLGVPKDPIKANEMLDQSRKLVARTSVRLIHNYVSLRIVDEFAVGDLEESVTEAGAGFQSSLQLQIAATLGNKKSKDYNITEAVKWYELAAENGQVWAMLQLALIHAQGDLGKPDAEKAFQWFEKTGGGDKPKHYLGIANLAICYQNGIGTAKDTVKAEALFKKHRDAEIVCYLGSIGQCPRAPVNFEQVTGLTETWAKQKNDPHAQFLLGVHHLHGWGVAPDFGKAVKWLKKAAQTEHGGALCQLGLLHEYNGHAMGQSSPEKNLAAAADYYRRGTAAGNVDATANYANMLLNGRGVARDSAKAEETYLKSLQLDPLHARAHCNLALIYASKLRRLISTIDAAGIDENRALMLSHFEESVRQEFAYAAINLGDFYFEGDLLKKDFRKAYGLYEKAVAWGLPMAHFRLGFMHEHGQGVPVTFAEAAYHYRLAALEGDRESLRRLINFYLTGTGVSLDLDRAVFWLQHMVRLGNLRGLRSICDILLKKGDYAAAVPLLRQLTDSSDNLLVGYGYDRLAMCYRLGLGVKANPARAERYAAQAIKRGNGPALAELAMQQMKEGRHQEALANFKRATDSPAASYSLGQMYYFGTHVEKDRKTALRYLRSAADDNHGEALYFLAAMTYNREPDSPPLDEAIRLAQRAENGGLEKARTLREKLEKRQATPEAPPEEGARTRSS